jgi:hypothetical protein
MLLPRFGFSSHFSKRVGNCLHRQLRSNKKSNNPQEHTGQGSAGEARGVPRATRRADSLLCARDCCALPCLRFRVGSSSPQEPRDSSRPRQAGWQS